MQGRSKPKSYSYDNSDSDNLKEKFLGLEVILDINVKLSKPLKFPEDPGSNKRQGNGKGLSKPKNNKKISAKRHI